MTRSRSQSDPSAPNTSIAWTNNKHAIIRKVVVQLLHEAAGYGHGRCPLGYFVLPLNSLIGGVELEGHMASFTEEILQRAFENSCSSSFANCTVSIGVDFDGVLHVRSGKQGSHRDNKVVHDIGLFCNLESAIMGRDNADEDVIIPKLLIRSVNLDMVSSNTKNSLQQFSRNEKKRASWAKSTKNSKKKNKKRKPEQEEDDGEDEADVEEEDIKLLRMKVIEDKRHQDEIMEQLEDATEAVERSTTALNEAVFSSGALAQYDYEHVTLPRKSSMEFRTSLHYYLGTASGVLDLMGPPSERVIVEEDLKRGLLDDTPATGDESENDNQQPRRKDPP